MYLQIFGQKELEEHIINRGEIYSHLISIGNPGRKRKNRLDTFIPKIFKDNFSSILRLKFYDVSKKSHLGRMKPRRIPKNKDVRKVINYIHKTRRAATGYTIHCWQGISRSTAIGLGILYILHQDEEVAIRELKKIRNEANPNPLIVKYFDEILECNLSKYNEALRSKILEELKVWFFNEIDDGDALLEELETINDEEL